MKLDNTKTILYDMLSKRLKEQYYGRKYLVSFPLIRKAWALQRGVRFSEDACMNEVRQRVHSWVTRVAYRRFDRRSTDCELAEVKIGNSLRHEVKPWRMVKLKTRRADRSRVNTVMIFFRGLRLIKDLVQSFSLGFCRWGNSFFMWYPLLTRHRIGY